MKAKEILMELLCAEGDSIKTQEKLVDLALSELRGLVMGMRCEEDDDIPLHKQACYGEGNYEKGYNSAVEAIADELFGKE